MNLARITLLITLTTLLTSGGLFAQGTAFTYQGHLNDGGSLANGSYDLRFTLFAVNSGGTAVAGPITATAVTVSNGLLAVALDFGSSPFTNGAARWLEIDVRTNGGGAFAPLTPRQQLTPTPYALYAGGANASGINGTIPAANISGIYGNSLTLSNAANSFSGNGAGLTALNASQLTNGTVPNGALNNAWKIGGNAGTAPGTHFLGTTDNQPLELKAGGVRAWRIEPNSGDAPSLIGGSPANSIGPGVRGATISGGGTTNAFGQTLPNTVGGDFGAIGGGAGNSILTPNLASTIGGGWANTIQGTENSTIGGGEENLIQTADIATVGGGGSNRILEGAHGATIGGGSANTIQSNAWYATISGGSQHSGAGANSTIGGGRNNTIESNTVTATIGGGTANTIQVNVDYGVIGGGNGNLIQNNADFTTIGGGSANTIHTNAHYATIPGGQLNEAAGKYGLAAGRRAKANHDGTFVWADSQDADFSSSSSNQFLVRAGGGARFETGGAGMTLDGQPVLKGTVTSLQLADSAVISSKLGTGAVTSGAIADGTVSAIDVNAPSFGTTFWKANGNAGTTAGTHFLGTTDNQPLEIKVNGMRVERVEFAGDAGDFPDGLPDGAPNVIFGAPNNFVGGLAVGATIAGGGATNFLGIAYPNSIVSSYSTIGGGLSQSIASGSPWSFIGGGRFNAVGGGANDSTIAGGNNNDIGSLSPYNTIAGGVGNSIENEVEGSAVGGGDGNRIAAHARHSAISGGQANDIGTNSNYGAIGGGQNNNIAADSGAATIAGGVANDIGTNSDYGAIGGGQNNNIAANSGAATIAGGVTNNIGANSAYSAIGGGESNNIAPGSFGSTIAGGIINATGVNSTNSAIGGGFGNNIDSSYGAIAGGINNDIGTNSPYGAIGGGVGNNVDANSYGGTIAGGEYNHIGTNSSYSTVGGGVGNDIAARSYSSTIAGGYNNNIGTNADSIFISGGRDNSVGANSKFTSIGGGIDNNTGTNSAYASIGGGQTNYIAPNTSYCSIVGGSHNAIGTNSGAGFVGGGWDNRIATPALNTYWSSSLPDNAYSTIPGGCGNHIGTNCLANTIDGGFNNTVAHNSSYATIPGGEANFATNRAFAAGRRAKANHTGSFVWGDATDADITSFATNTFTVRATGGVRLFTGAGVGVYLSANDTSWGVLSDRNAKKNFRPVDGREILDKLARLPIQRWNYKWEADNAVPHVGPMAQDFKAAFYPGRDDKTITTLEADGVALAAIQGLNQKLERKLEQKETEIAELRGRLEKLEQLLSSFALAATPK